MHDFMSRFSDDIEVKWGMVTDASLGAKVKITILATGFGVDDVMRPDLTGEEIAKRQKEETRYKDYYGDDGKPHPKEYITYTFNADTLDNEYWILTNSPISFRFSRVSRLFSYC